MGTVVFHDKVIPGVVGLVAVEMVDILIRSKGTPQHLFSHEPVLQDVSPGGTRVIRRMAQDIILDVPDSSALPVVVGGSSLAQPL